MPKWLILMSVLVIPPASAAPAWTWVDADGQVHYSDRPVPGARQIELGGAQTFPAPPPRAAGNRASTQQDEQPTARYQRLSIITPAAQQTYWNTGGNLNVQVDLAPALQPGHRVDLVLDGARLNLNVPSTQLTLTNVFRGTHTLQALITDARGGELSRSGPVSFTVQQTSIQNPNNANNQNAPRRATPRP